jgi:sulfur relay protein TusB/DsrH
MLLYQVMQPSADLSLVSQQDALLLQQDGVYLALTPERLPKCTIYMLSQDADARQITAPSHITLLSDHDWVALCLTASAVVLC